MLLVPSCEKTVGRIPAARVSAKVSRISDSGSPWRSQSARPISRRSQVRPLFGKDTIATLAGASSRRSRKDLRIAFARRTRGCMATPRASAAGGAHGRGRLKLAPLARLANLESDGVSCAPLSVAGAVRREVAVFQG